MTQPRKIQFTLGTDGGLQTKVVGGSGKGCEELTKAFETGLGGGGSKVLHSEYYEDQEQERVREGG